MSTKTAHLAASALASTALLIATACFGGESVSRSEVLESLVPTVVIPSHTKVADTLNSLSDKVRTSCADPTDADLTELRDAWRAARSAVSRNRAVLFGPGADRHSPSLIDWNMLEPERVDALLATGDVDSAQYVREFMPATARGLRAIEHILFADVPLDATRCNYVAATSEAAAYEAQAVVDEWTGGGTASGNDAYADIFTGNAASALLPLAAVSDVVRTSIFLTRTIVDMQLGPALGVEDAQVDLAALGEGLAGNGVDDLRDVVAGMEVVYSGTDAVGPAADSDEAQPYGLSDLVAGASDDADIRVAEAFKAALKSIDALAVRGDSLTQLVSEDFESVMNTYSALKELQLTLNTEVVSLLGISVGFADTDGDGG